MPAVTGGKKSVLGRRRQIESVDLDPTSICLEGGKLSLQTNFTVKTCKKHPKSKVKPQQKHE